MVKKHTEYLVAFIGGIITLIVGVLELIFGAIWMSVFSTLGIYLGLAGIIMGIMIIIGSKMFKNDEKSNSGPLLILIFGIIGVITFQGWFIGPILAIIASILILANK